MKKNILIIAALINFSLSVLAMEVLHPKSRALLYQGINKLKQENPTADIRAYKTNLVKQAQLTADQTQKEAKLKPALLGTKTFESGGTVCSGCYTSDGKKLVVGLDYAIAVLDSNDLSKQLSSIPFSSGAEHMAASPNNTEIVCTNGYPTLARIDIETGKTIAQMQEPAYCLQYSKDGKLLLCSNSQSCDVWDISSNTKVKSLNFPACVEGQWDPVDNNYFATCSDKLLQIWDLASQNPVATITTPMQVYQPCYVGDGAGTLLCAAPNQFVGISNFNGQNTRITYYDLYGKPTKDNQPLPVSSQSLPAICVQCVPNLLNADNIVASLNNSDCQIVGFDLKDQHNSFKFNNPNAPACGPVTTVACSPDGNSLVTAGFTDNVVNVWDISSLKHSVRSDPVVDSAKGSYAWHPLRSCDVQ